MTNMLRCPVTYQLIVCHLECSVTIYHYVHTRLTVFGRPQKFLAVEHVEKQNSGLYQTDKSSCHMNMYNDSM